jgi:hypothetical protein
MRPYLNLSSTSGVRAYDLGPDFIDVEFHDRDKPYRYRSRRVGRENVEQMKKLAMAGRGLGTFINQHPEVKNGYDRH